MKKSMKKVLSLALVLIMSLAVAIPALAANITRDQAIEIALKEFNIQREQVVGSPWAKADYELGQLYKYEVEFMTTTTEYEVDVRVSDGVVLSRSSKLLPTPAQPGTDIGVEAAKAAAFKDCGVTASQVSRLEVEKDYENGRLVYDIEFYVGKTEYSYEIDGFTGAVLEREVETESSAFSGIAAFFQAIINFFKKLFRL